jgi:hypothetical protein
VIPPPVIPPPVIPPPVIPPPVDVPPVDVPPVDVPPVDVPPVDVPPVDVPPVDVPPVDVPPVETVIPLVVDTPSPATPALVNIPASPNRVAATFTAAAPQAAGVSARVESHPSLTSLALTGSDTRSVTALALMAMLIGGLLILMSRRPSRRSA